MSIEEDRLAMEKQRFEFERSEVRSNRELEERRFQSEVAAKKWSQLATFVPVVVVILGFYLNQQLERSKKSSELAVTRHTEQVRFIERQLADFYYPVRIRLERDNAVWEVSAHNKDSKANLKIADDIEARLILPNHAEIMDLIKGKFHLLTNDSEQVDIRPLVEAMNRYQRHVTIYRALRESNDSRFPLSVCDGCGYPKDFEGRILERIKALEEQRAKLLSAGPR